MGQHRLVTTGLIYKKYYSRNLDVASAIKQVGAPVSDYLGHRRSLNVAMLATTEVTRHDVVTTSGEYQCFSYHSRPDRHGSISTLLVMETNTHSKDRSLTVMHVTNA